MTAITVFVATIASASPATAGESGVRGGFATTVTLTPPQGYVPEPKGRYYEGLVPKGQTATYTATVTNNSPNVDEQVTLKLDNFRPFIPRGETVFAVSNPYVSVQPSQGSCQSANIPSDKPPGSTYHQQICELGPLAARASAQVSATVQINESETQHVFFDEISGDSAIVNTYVTDVPPEISGSKKVKFRDLPSGCVDRDITVTASKKGEKKLLGFVYGPQDEWGGSIDPEFAKDTDTYRVDSSRTVRGSKIKLRAPLGQKPAGFYYFDVRWDPDDRRGGSIGDLPHGRVVIQRCGIPDYA